jgi:outer membrane receptor protein involved in Fe transport
VTGRGGGGRPGGRGARGRTGGARTGAARDGARLALAALCLALVIAPSRWRAGALAAPGDGGAAVDVLDLPPLLEPDVAPGEIDLQELLAAAAAGEDLVTGVAKREQTLGNVASAVTVISGDRLRRMGARTVGDAIATAAGIHLVDDRMSTRVGIRGLQPAGDFNTRILVIIDGTTVTESWSHLSGVGYDLPVSIDEIERIEVIRGPVSSIYGTNAFFGIINIITRGPAAGGQVWGRATAGQISGGSVAAGFALGSVDEQIRGSISATMRRGEEVRYSNATRDREMDAGEQVQFSLTGAYRGTFAQVRGFRYDRTIPFAPYESDFDDPYQQTNQEILADVGHATEIRGVQLSGRLFGTLYRFDDRATSPAPEDPAETRDLPLITIGTARTIGAELRGRYQLHELLGATAGLEATYNDTTSSYHDEVPAGEVAQKPAGDMSFGLIGLYLEADSSPMPWLGLTGGLRIDKHNELSSDKETEIKDEVGVSPRLAVFLSRDDRYGVKLLYATGFRYPNTYEAKFEDNRDFVGNNLSPERISSAEMVWWARPTATTWLRASAYRWRATQVIKQNEERFWVTDDGEVVEPVIGDRPAPPGTLKDSRLQFANDEAYSSIGLELEANYRDRRGWLAFAGASLVRARIETSEDDSAGNDETVEGRPPGSPRWTASVGVSSPKLAGLLHLSSELMLIGARPALDMSSSLRAFAGWNAAIYLPSLRGFDVTIGARNLLGRRQRVLAAEDFNRTGQTADFVPGEGRELYVRLGHAF